MVSRVLLRKLVRDIRERKWSFLALVAIMAVGVSIFLGMAVVYLDLDSARDRYYKAYRLGDFVVNVKRAPEWTLAAVQDLPNVQEVRGRVRLSILCDLPESVKPIPGEAISLPVNTQPNINGILLKSGGWFSDAHQREVILDHQFATANHIKPGDRVKALLLDKQHDLLVVGTAMAPEFVYLIPPGGGLAPDPANYAVMYLPHQFLQESCDLDGAYNELIGLAHDTSSTALSITLDRVEEMLDAYGVTGTNKMLDQPSVSVVRDELLNLKSTATIFPIVFLGVAALVLNVMISRLVAQQRVVVGTLRAVGHSKSAIIFHYLGFAIVAGTVGSLLGIAGGTWIQSGLLEVYRQFFAIPDILGHVYPSLMCAAIGIGVLFAVLGTLKGTLKAARLEPAEAMRPPPPEAGSTIFLERISFFRESLSFRWKMIFRSVFRNPFRSSVSVLAGSIATSLVLATLCLVDSTHYLINYHYARTTHEDLAIDLRDPKGRRSLSEASGLPAVSLCESQLSVICDLRNGPYRKRIGVTGLPVKSTLYTPLDDAGRQVIVPDQGLILTRKLAEILDVRVGDRIILRPLIAERRTVETEVVGLMESFLGLSAYCHQAYLSSLLGERWVENRLLFDTFPGSHTGTLMKELKRRPSVTGVGERQRSLEQMKRTMDEFMGTFLWVTVLFSGIIAFGSIFNTALVSLSERQREVGTFRVLGYTSGQVSRVFSGESFVLNGLGILVGLGLGVWFTHLLSAAYDTELYRFPPVIHAYRLIEVAVIMSLFVSVAQVIIYRMIKKLDWLGVLSVKE